MRLLCEWRYPQTWHIAAWTSSPLDILWYHTHLRISIPMYLKVSTTHPRASISHTSRSVCPCASRSVSHTPQGQYSRHLKVSGFKLKNTIVKMTQAVQVKKTSDLPTGGKFGHCNRSNHHKLISIKQVSPSIFFYREYLFEYLQWVWPRHYL